MGRIILSRKLPDGVDAPAILIRDFGALILSRGLDPTGKEVRDAFGAVGLGLEVARPRVTDAMFIGLRSPIDGGAPSNFAADAAVGAVAEAGKRTGRVGDLGFGFVNAGVGGSNFLTGFALDMLAAGAGFETGAVVPD